jgi:hypothetical protein
MSIFVDSTTPAWPGAGAYANVTRDMARMRRQLLDQTAAERRRRYMLRVLDAAIGQCERRNLAAPDEMVGTPALCPPHLVVALIERIQGERGLEIRPPHSNDEALDLLFELQQAYMPFAADAGDDDGPWAA